MAQAMDENKALQNTVHVGAQLGYFRTSTEARVTGIAGYIDVHAMNFSVVDGVLEMDTWNKSG